MNNEELKQHANHIRINILKEVYNAQSGHPGGSLSAADLLTVLYFEFMDISKENAAGIDRDRLVLSKGHASPLLYAVLAEKGILPEEQLMTFRIIGSKLQGHPNMNYVDGVDMSTGSLGQGLAAADGMAIANKLAGNSHRIYALLGDGECEEGEIWEAAMAAHHYGSDNLCAIWTTTDCRLTARPPMSSDRIRWMRSLRRSAGMSSTSTAMTTIRSAMR
jgi:transketolase